MESMYRFGASDRRLRALGASFDLLPSRVGMGIGRGLAES